MRNVRVTYQLDLFPDTLYASHGTPTTAALGGSPEGGDSQEGEAVALRRWVLFSLKPEYYRAVLDGSKKTEYRRGVFLKHRANAFVYCASPVMEVGVFVQLDVPVIAPPEEIAARAEAERKGQGKIMKKWLKGRAEGTAMPISAVQGFAPVTLEDIRAEFPYFHPPQGLLYLDKNLALLSFFKQRCGLFG